jgi:hypothetical protein
LKVCLEIETDRAMSRQAKSQRHEAKSQKLS